MSVETYAHSKYRRDTKIKAVTTTATLTVNDQTVVVTNGTYTITLPPVVECAGLIFTFIQPGAGTNKVTIADAGDDNEFANCMLNAQAVNSSLAAGKCVLYCDGAHWYTLLGTIYA